MSIENSFLSLNSEINKNNNNFENEFLYKGHKKRFKYFSKFYLNNYCEDCKFNVNDFIKFEDIKIEDEKINQLLKIINNKIKSSEEKTNTIQSYKILDINDSHSV